MLSSSRKDQPIHPGGRHVVGIDIAQHRHAAAGLTANGQEFGRALSFENNRAGIANLEERLLNPLGGPTCVLVGMEATGHYWMALHHVLRKRGYSVVVINPLQTQGKFRTRIRKTKTDPLDARGIARFVLSGEAKAARIPTPATLELRLLTRQRWRLVGWTSDLQRLAFALIERLFPEYPQLFNSPLNATGRALLRELGLAPHVLAAHPGELTRLITRVSRKRIAPDKIALLLSQAQSSIADPAGQDVLIEQLRSVLTLIETLEAQTALLDKELERRVESLRSPLLSLGIQAPLVATIHAESDPIQDFRHVWQFAAYTGLDPSISTSGNRTKDSNAHISKRGSPYLRHALYLASFTLYRRVRCLQRLYQKCRKAGHLHIDALVIVAHKLARIIWRLLTDNRPFRAIPPPSKFTAKAE